MKDNWKHIGVISTVVIVGMLMAWQPLFAHHGSNNYDTGRTITLKGTVTQFVWANPHSQLYFDVTDAKGNVTHWGAEMQHPRSLSENGFTKDIMKPGDTITISGAPARSGAPRMFMHQITLADGKKLPVKTDSNEYE